MNGTDSPLRQALDVMLFAPVGLALTARDELPELVDRGRRAVVGQLTMARMVGQFAATMGRQETERRVRGALELAEAWVSMLREPSCQPVGSESAPDVSHPQAEPEFDLHRAPNREETADDGPRVPLASELAIPGYDTLSASQVIRRLDSLDAIELRRVQAYEAARRARKTILQRVEQLQNEGGA